ncbi:hypothetical protein ET532_007985 [Verminephrobacter sp. Larva24]|nr:hypothetical protein ET532_007985 [Verminephrobacter sp. Larva24]MCW5293955.1 hypothetical protein [Verminephrobacter eiseniae]
MHRPVNDCRWFALGRRCQSPRYPAGASAVCAPPRQETHRFHFVPPFPGRRTGRPHHDPRPMNL